MTSIIDRPMTYNNLSRLLNYYFVFCYFVTLLLCFGYLQKTNFQDSKTTLFSIAVFLTYGVIYLLPSFLITKLFHYASYRMVITKNANRFLLLANCIIAVTTTGITIVLLYTDLTLYNLLGFHINGFVWNLITTPGGIDSMGTSNSATVTYIIIIGCFFGILALSIWAFTRLVANGRLPAVSRKTVFYLSVLFLVLTCGERISYGISQLESYSPILVAANFYPFYLPLTFRSLAEKLGFDVDQKNSFSLDIESSALRYPLHPLTVSTPEKPLNIIWMVAESWRWDMLDPEIMPATFSFSQKGKRFVQHYSGGIGTRMGMFSMFYGLYGPYWFSFLAEKRAPVLMDELQHQGYQLSMYTSAAFSYPEFDKTIFAGVPASQLHVNNEKYGWQSDQKNITEMLEFLKNRDIKKPFMTFMFFESPHARYYFPHESIIRKDFLQDFNYATMSLDKDIGRIFNRYVNASHHLDSQIKRVLNFLIQEKLLNDTAVIITGDHGEEFMEKGHWGHNSEFVEEQSRVPLIIYVPGVKPEVVDTMTSHLDIAPTVMDLLGVKNPPEDYSLGFDLLGSQKRKFTVLTDWTRICLVNEKYKAVFPYKGPLLGSIMTTKNDQRINDENDFTVENQKRLAKVAVELGKYKK